MNMNETNEKQYYVYILECADGTYYCGYCANLISRLKTHNEGKGSKYTRARLPARLVYSEALPDKSSAMKREYALKQLSHNEKKLIAETFSGAATP